VLIEVKDEQRMDSRENVVVREKKEQGKET
jgi:hypothetical protein